METHDHDTHNNLKNLRSQVAKVQDNYKASWEDMSAAEQSKVLASINFAQGWVVKLMKRVNFLALDLRPSASVVMKKRSVKLPEIKLITFRGDFDEWETFWSTFKNNLDLRNDLEDSAKLSHLLQSVKGEPNLPSPKHNAKELRVFLTEYHKIREQMRHVTDFGVSELVIRSNLVCKLLVQTYEQISDHCKNYDFFLQEMESCLQYIINKLETTSLILGKETNARSVEVKASPQPPKGKSGNCVFFRNNPKQKNVGSIKHIMHAGRK